MDAEQLRATYNQYFSKDKNSWSSTDLVKTRKVAEFTLNEVDRLGFHKASYRVLDVGCGTGYYTQAFHDQDCKATGLDYSDEAIRQASERFPHCRFVLMNGFEPQFSEVFDIIFCRGFSGANTHDLEFIAAWVNKYVPFLSPDGFFVLVYSSDFSGTEKEGETANLTKNEIDRLGQMINGTVRSYKIFYYLGWISKAKRMIQELLFKKKSKEYYSLFIQRKK